MRNMILGMSTRSFTLIHVLISLTGIGSGCFVIRGFLNRRYVEGWTVIFLITSILTTVTGFIFPFDRLLSSHILGLLSLLVLTIALFMRNVFGLEGRRRVTYVVTLTMALYF